MYSKDPTVAEHVLTQTTSGGACVNVCALQGTLPSLGFGGIGQSGSGRHHGHDGFREFSNPRGVVVRGTGDLADAFLPPYGPLAQAVVDGAYAAASAAAPAPGRHRSRPLHRAAGVVDGDAACQRRPQPRR